MKQVPVPYAFLDECAEKYAGMSLAADKPTAKVFEWRRRSWICVGGASRGMCWLEAELRQVVPQDQYRGRPFADRDGHHFYTGKAFFYRGQVWVVTALVITLVAEP